MSALMEGKDMDDVLVIEQKGAIVHLTLNRPEKRNALNDDMVAALDAFLANVPGDARAIVISGVGDISPPGSICPNTSRANRCK